MEDYNKISYINLWWKELKEFKGPYGIGIGGTKGEIIISRKSGFNMLKWLMPWLHTLENSKHYSLYPSEPKEFFEQLYVAYAKWKQLNVKGH